jgi:hypothetical protein
VQHVYRILRVALAVAVAAVPIALADPHVSAFIRETPAVATYYPFVAGVVYALYRAWKIRRTSTAAADVVSSSGAPTMGAK